MPLLRRSADQPEEPRPTTAMLRAERAREWEACFPGDASEEAYRVVFLRYSPLPWPLVHAAQGDLLRLLIKRVPAELGVPALLAVTALTATHPKPEAAARAALATLLNDLRPVHARTVLATLADAWSNAERAAYDQRGQLIAAELARSARRLATAGADTEGALSTLMEQLELDDWR
ncbi:hypothetical protein NET02_10105 [Thermomicrobiaceae bacterium CFH 74404]|uniref:Uncharacterized protein n=1 Tax=Thermalbibacter longus TaxID=2951981 RepID=A0AA41WFL7_9BACT|nr:hypothetical protein [Thermalbibacter longus]MCM8749500.1 hypothetical protein [Thermalbibacter longus]